MLFPSIHHLSLLCTWLSSVALAQRECDLDGATSVYNQSGLIVPFDNLCGRDIEAPLDFSASAEQRRSDCIDRCVKQAPLCYGFDYGPYFSPSDTNCYLMRGSFPARNATYRGFVADAGMLDPAFLAQLPEGCKTLGLRGCFERNGHLGGFSTASLATSTALPSPSSSSEVSLARDPQEGSGDLSAGAKAVIGAGAGLAALMAILCGMLFVLKRVKRKRTTTLSTTVQQSDTGDVYPSHKTESQIHACVATSGPEVSKPSPGMPAGGAEQVHEIDGHTRHEL